jgi:hypothetical protein
MTHQKLVQAVRTLQQRVDELEAFAGVMIPVFEREDKRGTWNWEGSQYGSPSARTRIATTNQRNTGSAPDRCPRTREIGRIPMYNPHDAFFDGRDHYDHESMKDDPIDSLVRSGGARAAVGRLHLRCRSCIPRRSRRSSGSCVRRGVRRRSRGRSPWPVIAKPATSSGLCSDRPNASDSPVTCLSRSSRPTGTTRRAHIGPPRTSAATTSPRGQEESHDLRRECSEGMDKGRSEAGA